jgi:kexin
MRDYDNLVYYAIESSDEAIHAIAQDHGLKSVERIGALDNYFLVSVEKRHSTLSKRNLLLDERVPWLEEQVLQRRLFKRAALPSWPKIDIPPPDEVVKKLGINDPGFSSQFHLLNHEEKGHDLNLTGVWYQGITGKNVTIVLLDDGVDYEHPDIKDNFFAEGSWDFNLHTNMPKPLLFDDFHGTRCAGEVSAVKNDICGVGIAYESKVAGIRILSGSLMIADEAAAINYMYHKNHIFSCSWGPRDDGATMDKPPKLAAAAFKKGIESGRDGLGSLFVFAAGNGGASGDNWYFF